MTIDEHYRKSMILQFNIVWDVSEERIKRLIDDLKRRIRTDQGEHLQESFELLQDRVTNDLLFDPRYHRDEDPQKFLQLIDCLDDVFKDLLDAFEESKSVHSIVAHSRSFFREVARRKGLAPDDYVNEGYSRIISVIHFVRNLQKHERPRPLDHLTGKHTFGNVFTLVSILILAIYAYIEILEYWLEVA